MYLKSSAFHSMVQKKEPIKGNRNTLRGDNLSIFFPPFLKGVFSKSKEFAPSAREFAPSGIKFFRFRVDPFS